MQKTFRQPIPPRGKPISRCFNESLSDELYSKNAHFRCRHCGAQVSADSWLSGVQNRNHCPYCLWSRHMDFLRAGDRLSACKGNMQPLGLTLKKTSKKYALNQRGELMLVHICLDCHHPSINRIAADDDVETIYTLYTRSLQLDESSRAQLARKDIHLLAAEEELLVREQLFGREVLSEMVKEFD